MRQLHRRGVVVTGLVVGALVAGTAAAWAAQTGAAGTGVAGCFEPVNAHPDDALQDGPGIQAAVDAATSAGGGTVCLASGHWLVQRARPGAYNSHAAVSTHGAHLTIRGTGPGTVVELAGDQGLAQTSVFALDPGASDVTIEDLTIDTSAATNTDEQTHAISIGLGVCSTANGTCSQPISDATVRAVRFVHPPSGVAGIRKGDCVRIGGNTPATQVIRATVMGSSFHDCARSGIAVQRNVTSLAVIGNHFGGRIGDTPFDGEATGGGDDGLRLEGNSFADAPATWSATLTTYRHASIVGNTFSGRGLSIYRSQDVVVSGNTFDVNAISGDGVVNIANVSSGDRVEGNLIRRHGVAGPGVRIIPHSGGVPQQVAVADNTIVLDGDSTGIDVESASGLGIRDNDISFTGPAPNGSGIMMRATVAAMNGLQVTGNTVTGPPGTAAPSYYSAVRLSASPFSIGGVTVALNSSSGAARSLTCSVTTPGTFTTPIVSSGNRWNTAPTCTGAIIQPGQ